MIFEEAGRQVFGEHGCYPMISFGKEQTLSAFKLLCRARNIDPQLANDVSKQINNYMLDRKHAIENNEDDPDYDVDDDININDYIDPQYHQLIEDSKEYQGIISTMSPHPCARLIHHSDLRREIGLVSLKGKGKDAPRRLTLFIEGSTADDAGYCKADLLMVDVVSEINDTFAAIGMETPSVDGLKAWIAEHPEVWDLYALGFTLGLNQTEQPASRQKIMQFKPKNVVELAAFIAGIRPGFKSLIQSFCAREAHTYGIPAMDNMLKLEGATGQTGKNSYLMYDEQILHLAQAAGIEPGDAVTLIKSIKKKKHEKVQSYKDRFIPGFTKYLIEQEGDNEEHAEQTAKDTWKVINDSASYLFNASHSLAMAYDSLYGAMLKTIAPYEFYRTLLKLYTDKNKKDKISLAADEMMLNKGIKFTLGRYGEDNTDWLINKDKQLISQAISSMKYMSKQAAQDLYVASQTFTGGEGTDKIYFIDLLDYLKNNTCLDRRQLELLTWIGYFKPFGRTEKLDRMIKEFFDGPNKISANPKSKPTRLKALRELEDSLPDVHMDIHKRLTAENDFIGLCFSSDEEANGKYFVVSVENRYGVKCQLYNCRTGKLTPTIRISKNVLDSNPFNAGDMLIMTASNMKQRVKYKFMNGERVKTDEKEWWIEGYKVIEKPELKPKKKKEEC